jgi:hypothetical protein
VTSALILLTFLTVILHKSGTIVPEKTLLGPSLSITEDLLALKIPKLQDKITLYMYDFLINLAVVLEFLILQDKHNIRTLSVYIKLIGILSEIDQKCPPKAHFSTVSKARTNKF